MNDVGPPQKDWSDQLLPWLNFAVTFVSTLVGIAVAILAIWGDWVRSILAAPDLRIELPADCWTVMRMDHGTNGVVTFTTRPLALYVHGKVVSKRRWCPPKNCRVMLTAIHKQRSSGDFEPVQFPVPRQFVWSPTGAAPQLASFTDSQKFDLGRMGDSTHKLTQGFTPLLYSYGNDFRGLVGANQVLRYTLQIEADYLSQGTIAVVEVRWDGVWRDNVESMPSHLEVNIVEQIPAKIWRPSC